jgi:hypothetical protein
MPLLPALARISNCYPPFPAGLTALKCVCNLLAGKPGLVVHEQLSQFFASSLIGVLASVEIPALDDLTDVL